MSPASHQARCSQSDLASALALGALDPSEVRDAERHVAECPDCRREMAAMSGVVGAFAWWPTDVLRPPPALWERLARRLALGAEPDSDARASSRWVEPPWEEVAPGISCQLLAVDAASDLVSMLVRLAPDTEYPPHLHAGVEELHLLDGELWIDDRKLDPGGYNRAEPGTADQRVWSETGCTCVLVTSSRDALR
jgi:anti-sigma factor ChrR (cupin superfamily)